MKNFDVIVIGAGSGLLISSQAASAGYKVAVIEEDKFGGTCLVRGCIPSKILIHHADIVRTIKHSSEFGIKSKLLSVDFKRIVKEVSNFVDNEARAIESGNKSDKNITVFKGRAEFTGKNTVKVIFGNKKGKSEEIYGKKIFICAGTRPSIPPIPGLNKVKYLTSTEALRLTKQPKVLTIIGGGYIAAELAYFFNELGTKINIVERESIMLKNEDKEISEVFTKLAGKRYNLNLGAQILNISQKGNMNSNKFIVDIKDSKGKSKKIVSDQLLVATGRVPNTDILKVANAGVKVNKFGYIEVNQYLETSQDNIWAIGDIAGIYLFKHSANLEAEYAYYNAFAEENKINNRKDNKKTKKPVDYYPMPHAVFTSPQIAGVGLREQDLTKENTRTNKNNSKVEYVIAKHYFKNTGMGKAMHEDDGFVKFIVEKKTGKILGCHIIGAEASTLIHEVLTAMKAGGNVDTIVNTVHIHPALSEVVQRAAGKAEY
ncbi:dihydrolipoyl dehydrogenase [Candidatus Woesearchaeota archaeon]|nr:dihydrolipoyl dehydrogenase [Candidatus Woesearchaeota archaeon]